MRKHAKTAKERGHKPKTTRQSHNGMRLCRVSLFARDCFQPFFTDARKDKKYLRKCFGKIRIAGEDFVLRIRLKDRTERMGGYYETCETVLVVFCHGCRRFAVCRTDCARRRIPVNFSVTGAMLLSSFLTAEKPRFSDDEARSLAPLRRQWGHSYIGAPFGGHIRACKVFTRRRMSAL